MAENCLHDRFHASIGIYLFGLERTIRWNITTGLCGHGVHCHCHRSSDSIFLGSSNTSSPASKEHVLVNLDPSSEKFCFFSMVSPLSVWLGWTRLLNHEYIMTWHINGGSFLPPYLSRPAHLYTGISHIWRFHKSHVSYRKMTPVLRSALVSMQDW